MTLILVAVMFTMILLATVAYLVARGSRAVREDVHDLVWDITETLPYDARAAFRALKDVRPARGMSREAYELARLAAPGTVVWNDWHGKVAVDHQVSEIPIAHRAVAPNFAPADTVAGFVAYFPDGTSPMAPYWSANKVTTRPALYPSIGAARQALIAGTREEPSRRLLYHTDTQESFDAFMASVTAGVEPRDTVKDPALIRSQL